MLTGMFAAGDPMQMIEIGVEKAIGQIKIGSDIYTVYQQIVPLGALPNNQAGVNYPHNINYVGVLSVTGYAWSGTTYFTFPRCGANSLYVDMYIQPSKFLVSTNANISAYTANAIVTYYR